LGEFDRVRVSVRVRVRVRLRVSVIYYVIKVVPDSQTEG
jgi:hypothetical protein